MPPVEFVHWKELRGKDKRVYYGTCDWKIVKEFGFGHIAINFDLHYGEKQWLLTLIHEIVHYTKGDYCRNRKFQSEVFRVMNKMNWRLL